MKRLLVLLALLSGAVHAENVVAPAVADCATTAAAFATEQVIELNPLGPVVACALKPVVVGWVEKMPEPARTENLQRVDAIQWGAAANNLAVIAGLHAAPAIGLMVALVYWQRGEDDREFARQCAIHARLAGHPMECKR